MIRAELDAAYFHLYGLERDEVEHVMDSFDRQAREEEPQNFGEFRTKRLILDAMTRWPRPSGPACRTRRFSTRHPDTALVTRNETF